MALLILHVGKVSAILDYYNEMDWYFDLKLNYSHVYSFILVNL